MPGSLQRDGPDRSSKNRRTWARTETFRGTRRVSRSTAVGFRQAHSSASRGARCEGARSRGESRVSQERPAGRAADSDDTPRRCNGHYGCRNMRRLTSRPLARHVNGGNSVRGPCVAPAITRGAARASAHLSPVAAVLLCVERTGRRRSVLTVACGAGLPEEEYQSNTRDEQTDAGGECVRPGVHHVDFGSRRIVEAVQPPQAVGGNTLIAPPQGQQIAHEQQNPARDRGGSE